MTTVEKRKKEVDTGHAILRALRELDKPVFLCVALLVAYGLMVIYSASLAIGEASLPRQALGAVLGFLLLVIAYRFDYRLLASFVPLLFVLDCLFMVLPLVPGLSYYSHGIIGWVRIPFIGLTFQTAELAKPTTVVLLAAIGAQYGGRVEKLVDYLRMCAMLAVPFVLILLQPDLGTGLVVLVAGATVIIMAGPKREWVLVTLTLLIGGVALILATDAIVDGFVGDGRSLIKDYQMNRLLVFLDPSHDTSGSGYNLRQSLIAVGSGGLIGKGLGNATQAGNGFLPEAHTDFVFALISEEFGFVGSCALIGLFVALVFFTLRVASRCEILFGKLIAIGIAALWTFQVFENIGMCLSLMPITGIPLPFISYGSSSMITNLLTAGLVLSISAHSTRE